MKANMPENVQDRAAFTYNAAADFFDASPLSFWDYFGRRTIELASLPIGSRVLDVCCGAGASALPAAEAVGQTGAVIGVDLAKELLELARAKAIQRRLRNVEFDGIKTRDWKPHREHIADFEFDIAKPPLN